MAKPKKGLKPKKASTWQKLGDPVEDRNLSKNAKYDTKFVEIAAKLKSVGFTNADISYALSVGRDTIQRWARDFPEFFNALEDGKENQVIKLVAKALRIASGYEYEDVNEKWKPNPETGELELVEVSKFKKSQPPNPKMVMFLLCNMDPDNWRSEHKIEVNHTDHVSVKLDGTVARKQIETLAGKLLESNRKKIESHEVKDRQPKSISQDDSEGATEES